jgi:GTPase SAR1 family protein
MGTTRAPSNSIAPIGKLTADVRFRVLVIGRANAGKTSILQRVCDTTESPKVYRGGEEVCGPNVCQPVWSHRRPGYT